MLIGPGTGGLGRKGRLGWGGGRRGKWWLRGVRVRGVLVEVEVLLRLGRMVVVAVVVLVLGLVSCPRSRPHGPRLRLRLPPSADFPGPDPGGTLTGADIVGLGWKGLLGWGGGTRWMWWLGGMRLILMLGLEVEAVVILVLGLVLPLRRIIGFPLGVYIGLAPRDRVVIVAFLLPRTIGFPLGVGIGPKP